MLCAVSALACAQAAGFQEDRYRQRVDGLLTPVLGTDGYRLDVRMPSAEQAGNRSPVRVLLVLNSRSEAVDEYSDEQIRRLLHWPGDAGAERVEVQIARMPLQGGVQWWRSSIMYAVILLTGLAGVMLWLHRRRLSGKSKPSARGIAQGDEAAYFEELQSLRNMAKDDPARVAQVLKQWIDADG